MKRSKGQPMRSKDGVKHSTTLDAKCIDMHACMPTVPTLNENSLKIIKYY